MRPRRASAKTTRRRFSCAASTFGSPIRFRGSTGCSPAPATSTFGTAWTLGRARFIDRFNGKGLFLKATPAGVVEVLVARVAMSKLFGTANYSSLEEDLVTNPFWSRDAVYAARVSTPKGLIEGFEITLNAAVSLDETADVRDPDAPGSTNTRDPSDEVTATAARFFGASASLTVDVDRWTLFKAKGVVALSHNDPNLEYVTNLALGGLGFSNIVYDRVTDAATVVRLEAPDVLGEGRSIKAEYFNIGANFNAIAGARREDDVLLTDGFVNGGELPTLNVANELIDFSDDFYESAVGWHGGTLVLEQEGSLIDVSLEGTLIEYNTDAQGRDMNVFPGFGGFTGYTDTDLFSYGNTNDRGRDPRHTYARDQARRTVLFVAKAGLSPDLWPGAQLDVSTKVILDSDLRDETTELDDYSGTIFVSRASVAATPLESLELSAGLGLDYWQEDGRSGTYAGLEPVFADYQTTKLRPFLTVKYALGPVSARYHIEAIKKTIRASDIELDSETALIWRSVGWLSAQF